MTLCGRLCFAGWSVGHNVKPRTSRRGEVSTRLVAVVALVAVHGRGFCRRCGAGVSPAGSVRGSAPAFWAAPGVPASNPWMPGVPVCTAWCHLLHCSAAKLSGNGESLMPINATGGTGELVTCVPRPGRRGNHLRRFGRWIRSSPAFWTAVTRGVPAAQRRTIGVVVCGLIGRLGPRRWHAGGLLMGWNTLDPAVNPWSARYDIVRKVVLCRMVGGAQCQTPHVPPGRSVHEVGSCSGRGFGYGLGLGYRRGHGR